MRGTRQAVRRASGGGGGTRARAGCPSGSGSPARGGDSSGSRAAQSRRAAANREIADGLRTLGGAELEAHRAAVVAYVRRRFGSALNDQDLEDVVQEAWAAALSRGRAGKPIEDLRAFLKQVAWRDARDMVRNRRPLLVDPSSVALNGARGDASSLYLRMVERARIARGIEAIEQLPPQQQAAYRARFLEGLKSGDACRRLGIKRSTYFKRLKAATEHVSAALSLDSARFSELQARLLSDYVAGVASGRARKRAERLIAIDPDAAALARELRRAHQEIGAMLAPVAIDRGVEVGVVDRVAAVADKVREGVAHVIERSPDTSEVTSLAVAGGGARGAGAVGAGVAAKLAGLGTAGKLAAACLGTGAAATVCAAAGLVPTPALPGHGSGPDTPGLAREASAEPHPLPAPAAAASPAQSGDVIPVGLSDDETPQAPEEPLTPGPAQPVAPTAPAEEREFGVAAAAVPAEGGSGAGGESSGAGGAAGQSVGGGSPVQQEFGP